VPYPSAQLRSADPGAAAVLEPEALAPLEDWLDAACAPLIGRISYTERQDLRNEMRQHLHSLVLAYRELGEPAEVAVDKALRKFGDPATMARQWDFSEGKITGHRRNRIAGQRHGIRVTLALCALMGVFGFALRGALPGSLPTSTVQDRVQPAPRSAPDSLAWAPVGFHHHFNLPNIRCTECHRQSSAFSRSAAAAEGQAREWGALYGYEKRKL
jgi:hypothetical protein